MHSEQNVRHPEVTVNLIGNNGNAFVIMGMVRRALKLAGVGPEEIEAYTQEATSGDYDNLLQTTMRWVNVN